MPEQSKVSLSGDVSFAKGDGAAGISPVIVLILATACALSVANLYYNQPLLAQMARDIRVTQARIGSVATASQIGYATGLLLLVPLGDILERRRLVVAMLALVTVALTAEALAPNLAALTLFSFAIGATTVVPQMLIPFGVHLSAPDERGKTVGSIMSGLLLGILLSRTIAGFVGAHFGWRTMFFAAAALMIALAIVLRFLLPVSHPENRLRYGELLRSVLQLVREQPQLREASLNGAFLFGAFSAFWSTLTFLLASPAYHYGSQTAGLFGLVGAVGALAVALIGRIADRRSPRFLVGVAALITLASFVVFDAWGGRSVWGLIIGVILLDLGVQAAQVTNQTRVYNLIPGASSRLNTVYMTTYFIGGALGSSLASRGWSTGGWGGVCLAGGLLSAASLTVNLLATRFSPPAPATVSE